jgi:hypothetical protein
MLEGPLDEHVDLVRLQVAGAQVPGQDETE